MVLVLNRVCVSPFILVCGVVTRLLCVCVCVCRYSGADLAGLVREAAMTVLRRVTTASSTETAAPSTEAAAAPEGTSIEGVPTASLRVCGADFEEALRRLRPSVSREDEIEYERMYGAKSWSKMSSSK